MPVFANMKYETVVKCYLIVTMTVTMKFVITVASTQLVVTAV